MKLPVIRTSYLIILVLMLSLNSYSCKRDNGTNPEDRSNLNAKIKYAGVRSSIYGVNPFPMPSGWEAAMNAMRDNFPGSAPSAIWIVGVISDPRTCNLEFPSDGKTHNNITFTNNNKHEGYLSYFDSKGIKVFLQVEPADADLSELIDLVLNKYKHHPSVVGFGVDVEWFREADNDGYGMKVTDSLAALWEQKVKSHNSTYKLFLKHWDPAWMPLTYRGDIVFVNDSQMFDNVNAMINEFQNDWAPRFYPNDVFFQIGYEADKKWWQYFDNPPKEIGELITKEIKQQCGIFWVDFTLTDVLPVE